MRLPEDFSYEKVKTKGKYFIAGKKYFYHESCEVCNEPFLSVRQKAVTCTRECRFRGERNGRFNDHRNWEELLGEKRAIELREEYSQRWKNDNPNSDGKHWFFSINEDEKRKWCLGQVRPSQTKGKTFEEIYGIEKAISLKQKISSETKKNMPEMGPPPVSCSYGYSGKFKGYFFRSLLELSYIKYLIDNNIKFRTAENREFAVKYTNSKGNDRNYYPDFYLGNDDKVVEIKPKFKLKCDPDTSLKFEAAKRKYGNRYVMLNEDDIRNITGENIVTSDSIGNIKDVIIYKRRK